MKKLILSVLVVAAAIFFGAWKPNRAAAKTCFGKIAVVKTGADFRVCRMSPAGGALRVCIVKQPHLANKTGRWFFVNNPAVADHTIQWVAAPGSSDFTVSFVDYGHERLTPPN